MIELENAAGFSVGVHPYGASWISCRVPLADGTRREVLLGCADQVGSEGGEDSEALRRQDAYLGACIGRFAGRIRNARLTVGGRPSALDRNDGAHCLHGGATASGGATGRSRSWPATACVFPSSPRTAKTVFPGSSPPKCATA